MGVHESHRQPSLDPAPSPSPALRVASGRGSNMAKYTSNDIQYLAQCIKDAKTLEAKPFALTLEAKPFAFLLGAGMSYSAGIPLARDLVKKINDEPHFAMHLHGLSDLEKSSYQKCMAKLTKEVRRRLLTPYLRDAKVNWASIAVAALMKNKFIARVLTFNFDSVLARACGISGHYPATYDFSVNPPANFGFLQEGASFICMVRGRVWSC